MFGLPPTSPFTRAGPTLGGGPFATQPLTVQTNFGQPGQSAFGQPASQTTFGQPAANASPFGGAPAANPFGGAAQPQAQTTFGQPAAVANPFGGASAVNAFGAPLQQPQVAFGQPAAAPTFANPFGGQATLAAPNIFGQAAPSQMNQPPAYSLNPAPTLQMPAPAASAPSANGCPYRAGENLDTTNRNPHHRVQTPPDADTVSCLAFSRVTNHFVATLWDRRVLLYEAALQDADHAVSRPLNAFEHHTAPVLCAAWNHAGSAVFTGSCDKTVKALNVSTQQSENIGQHDEPVSGVGVFLQDTHVVTGSWDKTIRIWDLRMKTAAHTILCSQPIYCMDVAQNTLVAAMGNRFVGVLDLNHPSTPIKESKNPLRLQTRSIAIFPRGNGYLLGSTNGRIAIAHIPQNNKDFQFVAHRERPSNNCYPINTLSVHPTAMGQHATATTGRGGEQRCFVSGAADGLLKCWDKDQRAMCYSLEQPTPQPITASAFNRDGTIMAYAVGYDWHKGVPDQNTRCNTTSSSIYLKAVKEADVAVKKPK